VDEEQLYQGCTDAVGDVEPEQLHNIADREYGALRGFKCKTNRLDIQELSKGPVSNDKEMIDPIDRQHRGCTDAIESQ
jgi:hypothetical protein